MVFDEKENEFLDNIIRGASNEQLFAMQQLPRQNPDRNPATSPSVGSALSFNLNKQQDQLSPMALKKENVVSVEGDAKIPLWTPPEGVVPKTTQEKVIEKSGNAYLDTLNSVKKDIGANLQDINQEVGGYKSQMQDDLKKLDSAANQKYQTDPDLQNKIDKAYGDVGAAQVPERDLLSQAILSLAPAMFGSITGESGAISQVKGGENARAIYDAQRKESIASANTKNSLAEKRYEQLLKIKNSGQEAFTKAQQLEMDRLKALIGGRGDLLKAGVTDQSKNQEDFLKTNEGIAKGQVDTGKQYVTAVENDANRIAAEKRARIAAQASAMRSQQPTSAELKAQGYLGMLKNANADLETIGGSDGLSFPSLKDPLYQSKLEIIAGETPGSSLLQNLIKDPKIRKQATAELNWGTTVLRDESGAVIGVKEAAREVPRYFARAGDTPEIIKQKSEARLQKEEALRVMSGRAAGLAQQTPKAVTPQKQGLSEQDKSALDWAKKHPKDPRATKILQKLGGN